MATPASPDLDFSPDAIAVRGGLVKAAGNSERGVLTTLITNANRFPRQVEERLEKLRTKPASPSLSIAIQEAELLLERRPRWPIRLDSRARGFCG